MATCPKTLYEEPDLLVKVIRDLFNEDFSKLVIEGDTAWSTVESYVSTVAPDLLPRLERYERNGSVDVFSAHRIDEQVAKALDRKVWLPSGGTLVIDRTEAMTVVDVNTGKFTGTGGNLEETVTRNNLEAAEEVVRQMRLRDIGGIIIVDFIDMVLESNRDLVLRRLTECLARDRTRHQVSEVTSLGLGPDDPKEARHGTRRGLLDDVRALSRSRPPRLGDARRGARIGVEGRAAAAAKACACREAGQSSLPRPKTVSLRRTSRRDALTRLRWQWRHTTTTTTRQIRPRQVSRAPTSSSTRLRTRRTSRLFRLRLRRSSPKRLLRPSRAAAVGCRGRPQRRLSVTLVKALSSVHPPEKKPRRRTSSLLCRRLSRLRFGSGHGVVPPVVRPVHRWTHEPV